MKRRVVITLIGCGIASALWPPRARSADKVYRIAFVVPTGQFLGAKEGDAWKGLVVAFLLGMQELGYVDGKNMRFDFYSAEGKFGQLDEIAARVLGSSPDVILAGGGGANEVAHAFQRATRTVPVVMVPRRGSSPVSPVRVAISPAFQAIRGPTSRPRDCSC